MPALAFLLACCALGVAIWIVVPAPAYWLLTLSVGAPELSPWIAIVAAIALLLALFAVRRSWLARVAALFAIGAGALTAGVLTKLDATAASFDRTMTDAFGPAVLAPSRDPIAVQRPQPIVRRELLTGLAGAPVWESHGVPFATNDGVVLTLDVYKPADGTAVGAAAAPVRPVVLQIYAGAWRSGMPGDHASFARQFAARGYVVFAIDYRHAPQWTWPAQLTDVRSALAWTRTHAREYGGDASRVALFGRSAGSQLALIAGITAADPAIRAIVAYYSPVDLTAGYESVPVPDTLSLRALEESFIGGTPATRADAYRSASPITYADQRHPPVLLVYGGRDRIIYPEYGATLAAHLRTSGQGGLLVIPWADHAFDLVPFGPSAQLALYYTERFLAFTTAAPGH